MKNVLCFLGFHSPNKKNIQEKGYWQFSKCKRCGIDLARDCHWIHGDGKWRDIKKYEELQ